MLDQENDDTMDFSSILASTVHDMKNSLSAVINTLDELTTELEANQTSGNKLASLKYETKRLNNQLIVLLTLYKLENKQYHLSIDEHNVKDFLEIAAMPYQELLVHNNISLNIHCANDLSWYFDESLVTGIIGNIVNNAYRYTNNTIFIEAIEKDKLLCIAIKDNGPGYPQSLLEKTSPTKQSVSFQSGSTGLGLYFSQRIAQLHKNKDRHGSISIDNNGINEGGRFCLFLP